jgi:adenylate kinase family enzyme
MQKVLIIGCSGSGKSTLARMLSERTGLPLVHLDQHYWQPGWVARPEAEWIAMVARLIDGPGWIMDGNYTRTLPMRLQAADMVLFFDFSAWRCLWGVFWRTVRWFGRTRPDMTPGCPERFTAEFLRYVARYNRDQRPRVLAALAAYQGRLHVVRSPAEAMAFLRDFDRTEGHEGVRRPSPRSDRAGL